MKYKVLLTNEAMDDVFNLIRYIQIELCNLDAANKLYMNLKREVNNMGDFPLKFADSGIKYITEDKCISFFKTLRSQA